MPLALITPYWDSVTITALLASVIATGLYFSNSAGALSVAHAALAGMGAYMGGVLTTNFNWPFPVAILAGAAVGGIAGVVLAAATLRMSELVAGLTTLAFGETMVVIAYNIHYIGGASSFYGIPPKTTETVAGLALAVILFIGWRFDASRLGMAARAVRDDRLAAGASGIAVSRVKIIVFALGAAIAGAGGALQAHYILVVRPEDMGFFQSLPYVIIWVFGGSYVFWGPTVGAFVLTFLPEVLRFSSQSRYMLYGLLLTVMVILRPRGIVPRIPAGRSRLNVHALTRLLPRRHEDAEPAVTPMGEDV